jgi:hypothetical protein
MRFAQHGLEFIAKKPANMRPWYPPLQRAQGWGTLSRGELIETKGWATRPQFRRCRPGPKCVRRVRNRREKAAKTALFLLHNNNKHEKRQEQNRHRQFFSSLLGRRGVYCLPLDAQESKSPVKWTIPSMEPEKSTTVAPVIVLLVILLFLYISYLWNLQGVLFPDAATQGTTTLVTMMSLALIMGFVFAIDAVRFDGSDPVLRWPVSSIISAYSYTTSAALVLTALFSDRTLGIAASMTLLCLGLALVRLSAGWMISLTSVVGCCAALAIINTGFSYTRSFISRAALYVCGSILLAELILLLRLAFRIKGRRIGYIK